MQTDSPGSHGELVVRGSAPCDQVHRLSSSAQPLWECL